VSDQACGSQSTGTLDVSTTMKTWRPYLSLVAEQQPLAHSVFVAQPTRSILIPLPVRIKTDDDVHRSGKVQVSGSQTMVRGGKSHEEVSDDGHGLRKLKVVELQARLRELKLPSSGTKEALFRV
jgi:hypothetical protein